MVQRDAERDIDTPWGRFRLVSYKDRATGSVHLALVLGEVRPGEETLVRVHEPISVLDVLDAGAGLHSWGVSEALKAIRDAGTGVMVLMNCSHSGETLQAQLSAQLSGQRPARQGRSMDLRNYGIGAQILRDLGVGKMRLLAAPRKMPSMAGFGLEVTGYAERR
jgi:3,4-dihydroxy 2-butanone 4-phosphate synthase/GTP cyclohydrolase II